MGLTTMKELLIKARKKHYAIGAFNIFDIGSMEGVLKAAEEANSPVILAFAEVFDDFIKLEDIAHAAIGMSQNVSVPVAIHLDHGSSVHCILRAIRSGFTSVMIDGSIFPLKENICLTREVVELAKPLGITVEAELGHVGDADKDGDGFMTNPQEAEVFIKETGVDALAVSIGNAHGKYRGNPKLDMDRITEINKITGDIPLVLHGGSGIPDKDFKEAIKRGIAKINIGTEIFQSSIDNVEKILSSGKIKGIQVGQMNRECKNAAHRVAAYRMKVFGSAGQA